MPNKAGNITKAVDLVANHRGTKITHVFFVADIGPDDFILGYPFLEASAPVVNWADAKLEDTTTLSTLDADQWQPLPRTAPRQKKTKVPLWVRALPGWSPGDEVWEQFIQKSTMAQQLAIEVNE